MSGVLIGERARHSSTASAATHAFVPTATIPAGSLAVIACGFSSGASATCADTKSNTWTRSITIANTATSNTAIFWSILTSDLTTSDTVTVTTGATATVLGGSLIVWSNMDPAPADQTATSTGTSNTTVSAGTTAALAQLEEVVVAVFCWALVAGTPPTFTPGSGYSQVSANDVFSVNNAGAAPLRGIAVEFRSVTDGAAQSPTGAMNNAGAGATWAGATTTFKALADPPADPVVVPIGTFSPLLDTRAWFG
jgi:hypothetical protein